MLVSYLPSPGLQVEDKRRKVYGNLLNALTDLYLADLPFQTGVLLRFFEYCTRKMSMGNRISQYKRESLTNDILEMINNKHYNLLENEPWLNTELFGHCPPRVEFLLDCITPEFYTLLCERVHDELQRVWEDNRHNRLSRHNRLNEAQRKNVDVIIDLIDYKRMFLDTFMATGLTYELADAARDREREAEEALWAAQQIQEFREELEALSDPRLDVRRQRSRLYRERSLQRKNRTRSRNRSRSRNRTRTRSPRTEPSTGASVSVSGSRPSGSSGSRKTSSPSRCVVM